MTGEAAKVVYKERAATAECDHAVVAAVPIAVFANAMRVAGTGLASYWISPAARSASPELWYCSAMKVAKFLRAEACRVKPPAANRAGHASVD